jgi:hypothetical protein
MPLIATLTRHKRRHLLFVCILAGVLSISGCVADDEVDKATTQFVQASTTLTQSYQILLTNANVVEADNFIVDAAFGTQARGLPPAKINDPAIKDTAVLTDAEIKTRTDAIKTLTDYTTALSTLAAGKPGPQIQTDAATASSSLKSFTTDLTSLVVTPPKGQKAPDFASPAALAVTAIGDVLKVIEGHKSAQAIRDSIKDAEPKITPLYKAMEQEAAFYFDRQTKAMSAVNEILLEMYGVAIKANPIDQELLLQLSDRLQQQQKDVAALSTSDPTKAIAGFESAHAALVNLITAGPSANKKDLRDQLFAEIKSFVAEVKTPSKSSTTTAASSTSTMNSKL